MDEPRAVVSRLTSEVERLRGLEQRPLLRVAAVVTWLGYLWSACPSERAEIERTIGMVPELEDVARLELPPPGDNPMIEIAAVAAEVGLVS
jgi:hypothetical protein